MNRRLSKYCILWLHQRWMKFVQKCDIIQCSTNKSSVPESMVHHIQIKIVCHKSPNHQFEKWSLFPLLWILAFDHKQWMEGGGCYCSTMCQYNKWNYPHRDSIIMPCIDQWTLTGSRSSVGVRICLSPEFPSVSSRAPWSLSVWQWLSPRWTSPSGASGEWWSPEWGPGKQKSPIIS